MTCTKIVIVGCVQFTQLCLESVLNNGYKISGLITKKSSNFNADFVDLLPLAKQYDFPIKYSSTGNDFEIKKWLYELSPDYLVCIGWSHLLDDELLSIPKKGAFGYHPSLLPMNRGRHPLVWALALGLSKTGSSFFRLDATSDAGDLISQEEVPIYFEDNVRLLYNRVARVASIQLLSLFENMHEGSLSFAKQDIALANTWRKRNMLDGRIDWRMHSLSIYNLIRALSEPYPLAYFTTYNRDIHVTRSEIVDISSPNIFPGKILDFDFDSIIVKTTDSAIRVYVDLLHDDELFGLDFLP